MTKHTTSAAILDAAARFYGQLIAQGGLPALAQVADKLGSILALAQPPQEPAPAPAAPPADDKAEG